MGPENLNPLFCFDSREGESGVVPLNVIFLFFFRIKKKPHAKQRCFSGFNGSNNGALN